MKQQTTKYFCYISEGKVNQLLGQIDPQAIDSITETDLVEKQKSVNPGINGLFSLFKIGASYGKQNRLTISAVKRETVIQRLQRVIKHLTSSQHVPDLRLVHSGGVKLDTIFFTYSGEFTVSSIESDIAYLDSYVDEGLLLRLACSMKYFSDMGADHQPHSGNAHFFSGKITPNFESLLLLQGAEDNCLFGSPVYLALEPIDGLNL